MPSPVTAVNVSLPAGMGLGLTTLGEAVCPQFVLENRGVNGCPTNALMGRGVATVEIPIGTEILHDAAIIDIFMSTPINEHTTMVFYAESRTPVFADVVFHGELLPDPGSESAFFDTLIPLVPTLPGGPDAAVVNMESTLGPEHITYYTHTHGKRMSYHPIGMAVPTRCPRGGYPFAATITFADGSVTTSKSSVPCSPNSKHRVVAGNDT